MAKYEKYKQGQYTPIHREKYKGKWPIVFRSSWELKFAIWCDKNPSVIQWGSESAVIRYFDPARNRARNYFVDFVIVVKDKTGKLGKYYVEIKPYHETIEPVRGKKKESTYRMQCMTYITNKAKWKAAEEWAAKHYSKFIVLTEKEIMI